MRRLLLLPPLLLAFAALAGCGLKGPLVMPPAKPGAAPAPVASAPVSPLSLDQDLGE